MAKTNCFKVGSIVKHNGRIGRVLKNAIHDCRYWEIDFCNTIEFKYYKDLELVSSTTKDYEEITGGNWWDGAIQLFGKSK